ncbi:hypothetical protein L3V77_07820 [Vibrio sp. DW001]|uniref:DUF7946 domain-containing protein n=1 Tax=Vibrio sp. DW001 TaxID=2912315 RepID=UPI0023B19676|nr:hypothetical protein [Vibrio sp. DW001]WED28123.1 hypothetical protein L3V77_07820 [Vibrio sp. DW001]
MKEIKFKISYRKGEAHEGRLDMYDASTSLQGFAKALSITTHALLNDGEIKKKGNRIEGAKIYIHPSRKGSFEELITLAVEEKVALSIGASVIANVFYDLIKWTWNQTLDKTYEPATPHVKKLHNRVEHFIGEMEEALEIPLEQAHRPIKQNDDMTISIVRTKVGDVVTLDNNTLKSVSLYTENNLITEIIGNITRYNILSGFGRFYDDELERTVSFKLQESVSSNQKQLLTWSMHHAQNGDGGKIKLEVKRVMSAKGAVKRYLVHKVAQAVI